MKKINELSYKDLKDICNPDLFKFETTDDLDTNNLIYGQERGLKALEFGLNVDVKGYNLFLEGPSGVGKTMYTKHYLEQLAKKEKAPDDWCYIYNFDDPNEPISVNLPAGEGKLFKEIMDEFIKDIKNDIKRTFNNEDFEKEKTLIKQEFEQKRTKLLEKLNEKTMEHGFQVKTTENGIYMMPVLNGNTINEEEFEKLDAEIKKQFEDKSNIVQEQIFNVITEIKSIEKSADKKVEEWQSNIALLTINVHVTSMKTRYKKYKKILKFLDCIKTDILKSIPLFLADDKDKCRSSTWSKNRSCETLAKL